MDNTTMCNVKGVPRSDEAKDNYHPSLQFPSVFRSNSASWVLKMCFAVLLFLHLDVWASLCRMIYVQYMCSFTLLEGCFHIHLLKGECLSVLTLNLSLRCMSAILWHHKFQMVQYTIHISALWKLEASSAHTLRMDFCPTVSVQNFPNGKYLHINRFCCFQQEKGVDDILRICNKLI